MPCSASEVVGHTKDRCAPTPAISLVYPFYNEAEVGLLFEIVCVNDGSRDDTVTLLLDARAAEPRIVVVDLSRNFGKEAALTATRTTTMRVVADASVGLGCL